MSLQYDVDFSMGKIDGLLKELEVEVTKSVGKGVAQGMENSKRNASKRGAAVGSEFKKGIQGGMGDLGISQATTKAGAQSTGAARTAGSGLGAAFGAMFSATALTSMGNSLMMGTGNLIARSYSLASDRLKSQVGLNQAIGIFNKRNTDLNSTLKDSTKTIEDKAIALGIDTKKLYTNAKAGGASIAVGEDLEKTIKSQRRALQDLTFGKEQDLNILERQLKKLKEENEARLKLARTLKGADRLEDSNKALETQIDTLKLQENELETNGLSTSAIKLQIEELNRKKETNDLLLNQVERETESIKTQGKALEDDLLARIEAIKAEISDANNRFELDTREATQKLEELKSLASSVSVGGGSEQQVIDPKAQQYIDALSEQSVEPTQFTDADKDTVKQELLNRFGKVLDESAINKLLTDLILGGLVESGDTATLTKLSSQLIDTAAINKSPNISLNNAITNLGGAVKGGLSELGNQSGLPENFATEIDPLGLKLLEKRYLEEGRINDALRIRDGFYTDAELMQARTLGVLNKTEDTAGGFNILLDSGALATEQAQKAWDEMYVIIGNQLLPDVKIILELIVIIVQKVTDFIKENPALVKFLVLFIGMLGGVLVILGFIIGAFVAIAGFIAAASFVAGLLGIPLGIVLAVIAGIVYYIIVFIAFVAILYIALTNLYQNNPFFKEIVDFIYNKVMAGFKALGEFFKLLMDGDFKAAGDKLVEIWNKVVETLRFSFDQAMKWIIAKVSDPQTWISAFNKMGEVFMWIWENILPKLGEFLLKYNWPVMFFAMGVALARVLSNALGGVLKSIIVSVGGDNPIANDLVNKIDLTLANIANMQLYPFETGGAFTVPQQYRNTGFPMLVHAGEKVSVTPESQVNNTTNIYGLTPYRQFTANAFL